MADSGLTAWKRALAAGISAAGSPLIELLGRTLTWQVEGEHFYDEITRSGKQPILGFWHGRILPAMYYFRHRGIVVVTSRNFDGEWIARIIERYGFGTARGSSSRGGARALVQLRRALASGRPAGFTLDGPRGPARRAQPGAVWLAGATGNPLLPFHIEAARHWSTSSWDRTQIPRPFSRMALVVGPPIPVSSPVPEVVEAARQHLESALEGLEERAAAILRN